MTNPQADGLAVVALIGPDGAGKSTLLGDLAGAANGAPRGVAIEGRAATVLDVRGARGLVQIVDFANAETEAALVGRSRFAGAVLVVAAIDSVLPGHTASLARARQLGIPLAAFALTKCDAVDDVELVDLVEMEIREIATKHGYLGDVVPVVRVRAASAEGRPREGREREPEPGTVSRAGPRALLAALTR